MSSAAAFDVVKARLTELEQENQALAEYITGAR